MPSGVYIRTEYHKKINSEAKKKKPVKYWLGKKRTYLNPEERNKKISKSLKGVKKPKTEKAKLTMKNTFKKGNIPWNIGKKLPKQSGENCHLWKGGVSIEPYTVNWTNTLKRSIRERDSYICKVCGKPQEEIAHHVHHIDYNKKNCNPDNLITLCNSCHTKTNSNREYWINYFKNVCK